MLFRLKGGDLFIWSWWRRGNSGWKWCEVWSGSRNHGSGRRDGLRGHSAVSLLGDFHAQSVQFITGHLKKDGSMKILIMFACSAQTTRFGSTWVWKRARTSARKTCLKMAWTDMPVAIIEMVRAKNRKKPWWFEWLSQPCEVAKAQHLSLSVAFALSFSGKLAWFKQIALKFSKRKHT